MMVVMADAQDRAPSDRDNGKHVPVRVLAIDHHWSSARGGVGTFNRQLCIALAKAGAAVECLVLDADQRDLDEAEAHGVRLVSADRLPGRPDDERLALPPDTGLGLHPDVVIGHGRVTGAHARSLRDNRFNEAVYLHFVHTDPDVLEWERDAAEDPDGELAQKKWTEELALMRRADRVLAVGPLLSDVAQLSLNAFDDVPRVIRIDPGFDSAGRPHDSSAPPSGQILVLGRLGDKKIKGLDIAARATAQAIRLLGEDGQKVRLLLFGAPPGEKRTLHEAVVKWSKLPGMTVAVRSYTTDDSALQDELRRSDLVLMPSRAEGFGLAGLEAIAAGVPVLISASSGLAGIVREVAPESFADMVLPVDGGTAGAGENWGRAIAATMRDLPAAFATAADLRASMRTTHPWSAAAERVLATLSARRRSMRVTEHPNHLSALVCWSGIDGREFGRELIRGVGDVINHATLFHGVKPGEEHLAESEAIDAVLLAADVVVFVLTEESSRATRANRCVTLLEQAQKRGKHIIVLRVDYARTPPVDLPDSTTTIEFTEFAAAVGDLAGRLAELGQPARKPDVPTRAAPVADKEGPASGLDFVAINDMPDIVSAEFHDRASQKSALTDLLSRSGFRLIQLEGADGIGKTALVKTVRDAMKNQRPPKSLRAFVYFSARGYRWITVPTLLEDLARAGGPQVASTLGQSLRTTPWRAVLDDVVAALGRLRVAVVIDDADELFDRRAEWRDRELRELLTELAGRNDHEVKVIMTVKRAREGGPADVELMRRAERVSLDRGLPPDFARSLLFGLLAEDRPAETSDGQLNRLLGMSAGHPRALELIAGTLRSRPAETDRMISLLQEDSGEPAARLFAYLFDKLELDERRVVQALAVFSRPVSPDAVTYLLKEVTATLRTEVVLRSLRDRFLIHSYGDRYYLPSADSLLALASLLTTADAGSSSALTQEKWWLRGAAYFSSRRSGSPARIEDLWPQLGEIELNHRARQWERALQVMNDVDDSYLTRWGQSHVLTSWRKDLRGRLGSAALEGLNLSYLVAAGRQYEGHSDDMADIKTALGHAETIDDQINAAVVSIQLASALVDRGHIEDAERCYRWAAGQTRIYGMVREQVLAGAGRATCLVKFGKFTAAQEELAEAFGAVAEFEKSSERDELRASLLVDRAWVARQRGDQWLDRRLLDLARDLAEQLGNELLQGRVLSALAANALAAAQAERAVALTIEAARIGVHLDNHRLLRESAVTRSLALLELDDVAAAAEAADVGARYARRSSSLSALGVQGLAAFRQRDFEKATSCFDKAIGLWPGGHGSTGHSDRDYHLLNAKGVVLCGLALLGRRPIDDAVSTFGLARNITSESGVLAHNDLVLRQFGARADGEMLARVQQAACGDAYGGLAVLRLLNP
jgi:glycosyltransferase involved in cell wall biosynthesis/tetratricopeptide (TPR) repeat protein